MSWSENASLGQTDLLQELGWSWRGRRAKMAAEEKEKIQLRAIYSKSGKLKITDQHEREFNVHDPALYTRGARTMPMEVSMDLPSWSSDTLYATVSIRVPVEVEGP